MPNKLLKYNVMIYVLGLFFSLVVFNTTYLQLGTILPILIMTFFYILIIVGNRKLKIEKYRISFLLMAIVLFLVTTFNDGDDYRVIFKVVILSIFYMIATSIEYNEKEVCFFIRFIVYSYLIYALYLLFGIERNEHYSRETLIIFGSELDPNIVAAVFVLPIVILLYNILYSTNHKIINLILLLFFVLAVVITGSRGGFVGMLLSLMILLYAYMSDKLVKPSYKIVTIIFIVLIFWLIYTYLSLFYTDYLTRSMSFTGDTGGGDGRTSIWSERLSYLMDSPLWGCGMIFDRGLWRGWANHNTYVQVLYGAGTIGITLFLVPIIVVFRRSKSRILMLSLFFSVFIPIFFLDTLDNRLLWNGLIIFDILSKHNLKKALLI